MRRHDILTGCGDLLDLWPAPPRVKSAMPIRSAGEAFAADQRALRQDAVQALEKLHHERPGLRPTRTGSDAATGSR